MFCTVLNSMTFLFLFVCHGYMGTALKWPLQCYSFPFELYWKLGTKPGKESCLVWKYILLSGVKLCSLTLFLHWLIKKKIKCAFQLTYLAAVCTGIPDYVMEKLSFSVVWSYAHHCQESVFVLINVYQHTVTLNSKSMEVFNSTTNNIKTTALIHL